MDRKYEIIVQSSFSGIFASKIFVSSFLLVQKISDQHNQPTNQPTQPPLFVVSLLVLPSSFSQKKLDNQKRIQLSPTKQKMAEEQPGTFNTNAASSTSDAVHSVSIAHGSTSPAVSIDGEPQPTATTTTTGMDGFACSLLCIFESAG